MWKLCQAEWKYDIGESDSRLKNHNHTRLHVSLINKKNPLDQENTDNLVRLKRIFVDFLW
jgi:hypothetical protein